jgi:hypothetical protein
MSHPAPSNAKPIRLTATRSHREARNSLISGALELNLMPFGSSSLLVMQGPCSIIATNE